MKIQKFDPNIADLQKMVDETKQLVDIDLEDKKQIALVTEAHKKLQKARTGIKKLGLSMREEANAYAKNVLAEEKKLLAITMPEEDRLASILKMSEELAVKKLRAIALPEKIERIKAAGLSDFHTASNDDILGMTELGFDTYFNGIVYEKNERDAALQQAKQAELDAKEKAMQDERRALDHQKEVAAAAEKARIDTEKKLKKEAEQKAEKEAADAKAAEEARIAEKKKVERRKAYVEWRESLGCNAKTKDQFKIVEEGDSFVMYKKVGEFKK